MAAVIQVNKIKHLILVSLEACCSLHVFRSLACADS